MRQNKFLSLFLSSTLLISLLSMAIPENDASMESVQSNSTYYLIEAGWKKKFHKVWNKVVSTVNPIHSVGANNDDNSGGGCGNGGITVSNADNVENVFVYGSSVSNFKYHVRQLHPWGCTYASVVMYIQTLHGKYDPTYTTMYNRAPEISGFIHGTTYSEMQMVDYYFDFILKYSGQQPTRWVPYLKTIAFNANPEAIYVQLVKTLSIPLQSNCGDFGYTYRPGNVINFKKFDDVFEHALFAYGVAWYKNDKFKYGINSAIYVADPYYNQFDLLSKRELDREKFERFQPVSAVFPAQLL